METRDALQRAVEQWREAEAGPASNDRLSAAARAAILDRTRDRSEAGRLEPLGWLFFPAARLALAGALPVAILTLAVGYLALVNDQEILPSTAQALDLAAPAAVAGIEATKDGDTVVFLIANGSRVHRVYASESPQRFEERPEFTTRDGAFEDRLDRGGTLVFYRIE